MLADGKEDRSRVGNDDEKELCHFAERLQDAHKNQHNEAEQNLTSHQRLDLLPKEKSVLLIKESNCVITISFFNLRDVVLDQDIVSHSHWNGK